MDPKTPTDECTGNENPRPEGGHVWMPVCQTEDTYSDRCYYCPATVDYPKPKPATPKQPGLLTPEQLREIEERAEKATEGPWYMDYAGFGPGGAVCHKQAIVSQAVPFDGFGIVEQPRTSKKTEKQVFDDGDFIAHARTDIPALLRHIATQDQWMREARGALSLALPILRDYQKCLKHLRLPIEPIESALNRFPHPHDGK